MAAFVGGGLAACGEAESVTAPAASALFSCLYSEGVALEAGEVLQGGPAEGSSLCLDAPSGGAEYLLVPFHSTASGTSVLIAEVSAGGSTPAGGGAGGAQGSLSPAPAPGGPPAAGDPMTANGPERDWAFHLALREREARELTGLIPAARAAARGQTGPPGAPGPALGLGRSDSNAPAVGDLLELNAAASCGSSNLRTGRVEAVGQHAVVVADTLNPGGGFAPEDYQHFAATFDTLVYPVNAEHFGNRTDLDGSGRTTLFFTRAVNELTPPGAGVFVAGFFWAGDLFPRAATSGLSGCPGSNFREMFYLLVPDPSGVTGNVRTTDFVRRITVGVVGHEDQHLINAARRIYFSDATDFELTWLNEALSHTAEELLFYATTPYEPRQNLGREDVLASEDLAEKFTSFAWPNLVNYGLFIGRVEQETPIGLDRIATRGAAWSLLRYLADHQTRPEPEFFRQLVGGPRIGLDNLEDALGEDPLGRLQDWSVSVFTDDFVGDVRETYTQPSWNHRSILHDFDGAVGFPLPVRGLPSGTLHQLNLKGGTSSYIRFGVAPEGRALLDFSSNRGPPSPRMRWTVVRTR